MPNINVPYVVPNNPLADILRGLNDGLQQRRMNEERALEQDMLKARLNQMKAAEAEQQLQARAREFDSMNEQTMRLAKILQGQDPENMGPPTGPDAGMMNLPPEMGAVAPPQQMGEHPLLSIFSPKGDVLGSFRPQTRMQVQEQEERDLASILGRTQRIKEAEARGTAAGRPQVTITQQMIEKGLFGPEALGKSVPVETFNAVERMLPNREGGSTLVERYMGATPEEQARMRDANRALNPRDVPYGGQPRVMEDESGNRMFVDANGIRYKVPKGFRLMGDDAPAGFSSDVASSDALFKLIDHAGNMLSDPKYAGLTGPLKGRIGEVQMSTFGGLGLSKEQMELYPTLDKYLAEEVFGKGGKQLTVNEKQIISKYLPNKNDTVEFALQKLGQAERELASLQLSRLGSRPLNELQGMPGYQGYKDRASTLRWYKGKSGGEVNLDSFWKKP